MSIDKIAFQSLEQSQQLPPAKKEEVKNVPDNELSAEDKEKANASKYMIGAAALAGVIALGIIGHKNNWWRRAQDIGEDIAKKGSDAVQGGERKAAQTAEDAASAGSKADDIQTPNPNESSTPKPKSQPEEKADSVPKEEPQVKEPEIKKPVEEKTPVESPKQEEISVEPPKPELKGRDLISDNLESLDPKMGQEKVLKILADTRSEINKLPVNEKLSYFKDYLDSIKKVQDVFPEKLDSLKDPFYMDVSEFTPGQRKLYVNKVIEFAKENPRFEYPAVSRMLSIADDFSFMADPKSRAEGLDFMKLLYDSGLKHDRAYLGSYANVIDELKPNKVLDNNEKEYCKLLFKFDLRSGIDEYYAKQLLEHIWQNPDGYRKVFDTSPIKLDSAIKKSYNEMTGKILNYTPTNSAMGYKHEIEKELRNSTYIDNYTIDYSLLPRQKKGAWSMVDMKQYYEKDLNFDAAFKALETKEKDAIKRCKNVIDRLPKEVQPQLYAKYFEALKKYSPKELNRFSFPINDLKSAELFLNFAKENPQHKELVSYSVLALLKKSLPEDSYIDVLKLLKNNNADFGKRGMERLNNLFEPFASDVYYKKYVDSILVGPYYLLKVGKEKAAEFRRLAFDLYIKNGITQKDAAYYIKQSDTHLPELLGMSKEEFLNIINSAVKND